MMDQKTIIIRKKIKVDKDDKQLDEKRTRKKKDDPKEVKKKNTKEEPKVVKKRITKYEPKVVKKDVKVEKKKKKMSVSTYVLSDYQNNNLLLSIEEPKKQYIVTFYLSEKIGESSDEKKDKSIVFPSIVENLYDDDLVSILPEDIPAELFQKDIFVTNSKSKYTTNNINLNVCLYASKDNILLPEFHNKNGKWPTTSPYACWNCDRNFDTYPIGIPDAEYDGLFYCYGNMCNVNCTARYIKDHEDFDSFTEKYTRLCILNKILFGLDKIEKVRIADPKETLKKYGGPKSYDQYHENHNKSSNIYKLPLIPIDVYISDINNAVHNV